MSEKPDFALVPRSASALEKAVPGAKRILSGMVADTLALVRKKEITKRRIVILDDAPEIRMILIETLEMFVENLEFVEFCDGHEALQELFRRLPDLLVTDINHPGLECEEMFRRLQERKANLSILVLSGSNKEKLKGRLREWPGLRITFLPKPFTPSGVLEEILMKLDLSVEPELQRYFREHQQ